MFLNYYKIAFKNSFSFSKFEKILIIISLFFQSLYLLFIPFGFECDAATYYQYAKAFLLQEGFYVNFDRPPLYPLMIVFSGAVLPGTFLGLIILHAFFGVASVILFNRILLFFCSKSSAFWGTLVLIFSGIAFSNAKLIMAEQSFIFFFLLSIFFFIKAWTYKEIKDYNLFFFSTLVSGFIRWEALIFFILGLFFLSIPLKKVHNFSNIFKPIIFVLLSIFSFTILKSVVLKDSRYIGSITERSGNQLFWKAMVGYQHLGQFCSQNVVFCNKIIDVKNGVKTQFLYDFFLKKIKEDPDLVLNKRNHLSKDIYNKYFAKFENNQEELVEFIFSGDHNGGGIYWTLINTVIENSLGKIDSNKLFIDVVKEGLIKNKMYFFDSLISSVSFLGMNIIPFFDNNANLSRKIRSIPYNLSAKYHYIDTGFDAANCASNNLNNRMWKEYLFDKNYNQNLYFKEQFQEISSFLRNFSRITFGIIFLFFSFIVCFLKNKNTNFFLFLVTSLWAYMIVVGFMGGGIYTRQEIFTLPILILIGIINFNLLKDYLKKKYFGIN